MSEKMVTYQVTLTQTLADVLAELQHHRPGCEHLSFLAELQHHRPGCEHLSFEDFIATLAKEGAMMSHMQQESTQERVRKARRG